MKYLILLLLLAVLTLGISCSQGPVITDQIRDFPPPEAGPSGSLPDTVLSKTVYEFHTIGDETLISYKWLGPNYITVVNNKTGKIHHVPMMYRDSDGKEVVLGGGNVRVHQDKIYALTSGGIIVFDQKLAPIQLIYPPNTHFTDFLDWDGDWLMAQTNDGLYLLNQKTGENKFLGNKQTKGRMVHKDSSPDVITAYRKIDGHRFLFTDGDGILELNIQKGTMEQLPSTIGVAIVALLGSVDNKILLSLNTAVPFKSRLYWFDPEARTLSRAEEFSNVTAVMGAIYFAKTIDSLKNGILFIDDQVGLGYWHPDTKQVTWTTYQDGFLKKDWIYAIYDDGQYIWLGYARSGAQRIEKKWLYDQLSKGTRTIEQVVDSFGHDYRAMKADEIKQVTESNRTHIPPGHEMEFPEYLRKLSPSITRD